MNNNMSAKELNIGDYVRTKKGIAKYLGLGKDVLKEETNTNTYNHYYNQHIFDNYVFNVGHDYGDTLTENEITNIDKLGIVKPRIIDLIEVGDYVNGYPVMKTGKEEDGHPYLDLDMNENVHWLENIIEQPKDIKTIVTKEQFESMEYKIESEVNL